MELAQEEHEVVNEYEVNGAAIIGKRITRLRSMTKRELKCWGWELGHGDVPMVIELEDGSWFVPQCDEEGNGPGALYGSNGHILPPTPKRAKEALANAVKAVCHRPANMFLNTVLEQLDALKAEGGRDHDDRDSDTFYTIIRAWEKLRGIEMPTPTH